MGHDVCRAAYLDLLRAHLAANADRLCDEHRTTWSQNPLRVLDCKDPACIAVTAEGPMLIDHLCDECRAHFDQVIAGLTSIDIVDRSWTPAWFAASTTTRARPSSSWPTPSAARRTPSAGEAATTSWPSNWAASRPSGIGFGSGIERLLLTREAEGVEPRNLVDRSLDLFVIDTTFEDAATVLVDELRAAGFATDRAYDNRSMKSQMKVADKSGARLALLVGPQELDGRRGYD